MSLSGCFLFDSRFIWILRSCAELAPPTAVHNESDNADKAQLLDCHRFKQHEPVRSVGPFLVASVDNPTPPG
jgi:hypothetical protein